MTYSFYSIPCHFRDDADLELDPAESLDQSANSFILRRFSRSVMKSEWTSLSIPDHRAVVSLLFIIHRIFGSILLPSGEAVCSATPPTGIRDRSGSEISLSWSIWFYVKPCGQYICDCDFCWSHLCRTQIAFFYFGVFNIVQSHL